MKNLLILAVLTAAIRLSVSSCPSDWVTFQQKCYYFSKIGSIPLSWHEASSRCESMRGTLVVIETAEENNFLFNELQTDSHYIIGLHDLRAENVWQWVDGQELNFVNWGAGQPDNWQGSGAVGEDCVEMVQNQGGAWNDIPCSRRESFICEREINLEPFPNCLESEGWEEFNERCYKIVLDKLPWSKAEEDCVARGGHLVGIASSSEQSYVSQKINENNEQTWIGLSTLNSNDQSFQWSNQADSPPGYENWGPYEPNINDPNSPACVGVDPSIASTGPWAVERCGNAHAYMCESGFTSSCAEGWYLYKGVCYFQASSEQLLTSWVGAKTFCEDMNAGLVIIDSMEKQDYILSRLPDIGDERPTNVWIGISDSLSDGVFKWVDGSSAVPNSGNSFTNWHSSQPVNRDDAWDCGQIFTGSSWGAWEVDDCFLQQAFMCEIPPGVDVTPDDSNRPSNTGCDPGWIFFQDNCYYFEHIRELTWTGAEQDCVKYGGHLVSIVTGEENAFVVGLASGSSWIGAHDNTGEGKFSWTDNSPFTFQNWAYGEPNNNEGEGDCAQLWMEANYEWDDMNCDRQRGYICKAKTLECDQPLGMENGLIPNSDVTASSQWNENHAPYLARLNNYKQGDLVGAWIPESTADGFNPGGTDWIQVKFLVERRVTGITTQGRPSDFNQYVTSYKIKYSNDGNSFVDVGETFTANQDTYTPVTNHFRSAFTATYVRLYPMTWNESPALRMEILGCNSDGEDLATPSPHPECTNVALNDRLDCGYPGITGQECITKGCCWDQTQTGYKWCFYKQGDFDLRCGKDWEFDPNGEYFCYHFNDHKRRTWSQARENCLAMKSDLLSIQSMAEQSFVTSHLSYHILANSMWIGANRLDADYGWNWVNGLPFNYVNWQTGEPNGFDNGEGCVEIYTGSGRWNDHICNEERGFACKKLANNAPPVVNDDRTVLIEICEGSTSTIACPGNQVLAIHHAVYGRTNDFTCGEGNLVPEGGCVSDNSLDIVSKKCNNLNTCTIEATSDVFGDPCPDTYKYLTLIFSCESKACYQQLGVENGTVADSQLSASSRINDNHKAIDGRLNGARSWATNAGVGSYIQVTFPQNIRVSGIIIQGAGDAERWVTKFKVAIANDDSFVEWTDYTDYDKNVVNFVGNTDASTAKRVILAEHVFSAGIRILPLEWAGDMIGMRFDVTGCNPLRELTCQETGDIIGVMEEGEIIQADCPGLCPFLVDELLIYGSGIYAGNSQICNAAVHAGVIIERFGGPVTLIKKPAQSTYKGSVKNTLTSRDFDFYPVAFSFTNNEKNCEAGWIPYLSHCYWMPEYGLTWFESEAACVSKDSHLVSVYDQVENDFLTQMVHQHDYQRIWLGLSETRTINTYEWSDDEIVTYTNWMPGEPNNHEGASEKCVHMYRDTTEVTIAGKWNDVDCSVEAGFVCKKFKSYYTEDEAAHPTPAPGCKEGWMPYDYTCYLFHRELVYESQAEDFCKDQGGVTVHINNKYTQSFVHTVVGAEDYRWWLGLHAVVSQETGVIWQWESGDPVTYDNWGPENPRLERGECVVMYGGPFGYGLWFSRRCDEQAFTICEAPREGFTPPPPTTPPPVGGCIYDWTTPNEESQFCYKVYSPADEGDNDHKQAWNNAQHQCTALGADLVSIHSMEEEAFLIREIAKLDRVTEYVWIGLNNKGFGDWTWSDGSSVQFTNWALGSPSNNIENNCVSLKYDMDTYTGFWENTKCQKKLDWLCKIKKGIEPVVPTEPPTGVPDRSCGDDNDGMWIRFEDNCYLFSNGTSHDVYSSERICINNNAYLTSIHSSKEQAFIYNVIQTLNMDTFWIGLKEIGGVNGEFQWTDSTPLDFVFWNQGEPNNGAGMEQCVVMFKAFGGRWNDANCGLKYASFICKKYPNGKPINTPPPFPVDGGCPENWFLYGGYCYKIMGDYDTCDPEITGNQKCAADFGNAQLQCVDMDANLVSIHDKYENAFITAQSYRAINNMWTGLSSYALNYKPFTWANGDEVTYTNWNEGEPNAVDGSEHCVEFYRSEAIAGRWNDVDCDYIIPYVCFKKRDQKYPLGKEINNNRDCPNGWVQYDAINDNRVCYYLESQMMTFVDAQQNCKKKNANLVSLHSNYEQAFLTSYVRDKSVWLGLHMNSETMEWNWIDQWPVWVTNWGEYEPGSDESKKCVINQDSALGSDWVTANCEKQYMSVCKISHETVPTTPGYVQGYCEDPSWLELGGYCYFAFVTQGSQEDIGVSWGDAEKTCNNYNGHLASFSHRSDLEWVLSWYNYSEPIWIGLGDNGQGGWSWTDYRPVTFTNWNTGEPNNYGDDAEDCVEMMSSGKWNDVYCLNSRGYLCRIPKVVGTDENGNVIHYTTPKPPEKISQSSNAGVIAGAVIGGIVAIIIFVGIAVYCTRNSGGVSKLAEDAANIPSGIVNKLYSVSGKSGQSSSENPTVDISFDKENGATFGDSNA